MHIVKRALDILCSHNLLAGFERRQEDISAARDSGDI
jgi:hypothetical protein